VDVAEAIRRELDDARAAERPVASVRVTDSALPGAVVAVSLAPERSAELGLDAQMAERAVEIIIHPDDFAELLETPAATLSASIEDGVRRIFGVPLIGD
jgi:hypothetical protein